jgi:hypothetical protein
MINSNNRIIVTVRKQIFIIQICLNVQNIRIIRINKSTDFRIIIPTTYIEQTSLGWLGFVTLTESKPIVSVKNNYNTTGLGLTVGKQLGICQVNVGKIIITQKFNKNRVKIKVAANQSAKLYMPQLKCLADNADGEETQEYIH